MVVLADLEAVRICGEAVVVGFLVLEQEDGEGLQGCGGGSGEVGGGVGRVGQWVGGGGWGEGIEAAVPVITEWVL